MTTETTTRTAGSPAIPGHYADPALVSLDGRFYLYPTTDGTDGWSATAFEAFSSDDLVVWRAEGEIFSVARGTDWAEGHAWAPAVVGRGGRYYLYFTADDSIGVAVSASPTGPFVDSGRPLVARGAYAGVAIDPSVFVDDDGTAYLLWGNSVAHLVVLNDDMVSFDPATETAWTPTGFREAPSLHRAGDVYVLSWSENDTREADYRVRYATSPSARGPWTDRGVLLQKDAGRGVLATGHHSVLRVSADEWVIAYHRFAIPGGNGYRREIALDTFRHSPDGTIPEIVPGSTRVAALGVSA
ncbi:family 43 glycosylhydrolase [Rathayibacter festucae]|uniref:family 43 glycosylhydrolase n=1 Tax=Rathayibacter festucae TaxID=110937 RepID=UPI002A6B6C3D|nr:family 43 glycosylhydrolase [Rathayibacter festucae]MDY0913029.1 family 43 glycosylhydrolase [Rathayibacter festucae]